MAISAPPEGAADDRMADDFVEGATMLKRLFVIAACFFVLGWMGTGLTHAQTIDPDTKAAAKELMAAMRVAEQMKAILPTIMQTMKPAIVQGRAEVERDYNAIQGPIMQTFTARMDDLIELMVLVYSRHFTAAEMREMTKFVGSPIGQRFIEKMPAVLQEGMVVGQKFGESLASELVARMTDELRKRGHKI
jgi:hypothetical protein